MDKLSVFIFFVSQLLFNMWVENRIGKLEERTK